MPTDALTEAIMNQSPVAWIMGNNFITENGKPIEFVQHRFMIDYLADDHPHKVSIKCSQVGLTVAEFLDDFHLAGKRGMNVIHTFHTSDILQSVVEPKVNPLIAYNPAIRKMVRSTDSQGLKKFNDNFLYLRGANSESQAISVSADVLKIDEKDRSNLSVVEMFESRLDFSKYKWIREFSNPSSKGVGVDAVWQRSNQFHWFVKCPHCGHNAYIDFEEDKETLPKPHYVDQDKLIYACGSCGEALSDRDRIRGEWIAKYPARTKIHGYWFSQMMAPWFSAEQIVEQFNSKSIEYFYNFVLGKPYTASNMELSAETILRACRPGSPLKRGVVMGSDIGKPHWYWLGNQSGVFEMGRASSWDELERIFLLNNCDAWVADAQPEFTEVQAFIRKYPGKFYACRYIQDSKGVGIVRWQTGALAGFVYADRTKIIDRLVSEITSGDIRFLCQPDMLGDFINHAGNIYRSVETNEKGRTSIDWLTVGGEEGGSKKADHLVHAGVYWRIALEQSLGGNGFVNDGKAGESNVPKVGAVKDGRLTVEYDVKESLARARNA